MHGLMLLKALLHFLRGGQGTVGLIPEVYMHNICCSLGQVHEVGGTLPITCRTISLYLMAYFHPNKGIIEAPGKYFKEWELLGKGFGAFHEVRLPFKRVLGILNGILGGLTPS